MKTIKVTAEEKESMLQHCSEVKSILDKYPWFDPDPNKMYVVTATSRCKTAVEFLIRYLECLECEDPHENN